MDHVAAVNGVIVVDKPVGLTSAQVVATVKKRLRAPRAGHTGTLDPLASGVLPVCLGEATKLAGMLLADDKGYEAELELGATTDTLDVTGTIVAEDRAAAAAVTADDVRAMLPRFTGRIEQVLLMGSAIKVNNKRMYELARKGKVVERAPREVLVHRLELLAFTASRARLAIACSKGTYVRTLVDDLGRALGCGAHLTALRRTRAGAFGLEHAVSLDALPGPVHVFRPADLLDLPRVTVPRDLRTAVWNGHPEPLLDLVAERPEGQQFQMVSQTGDLLALCHREGPRLCFDRVFRIP